jgi:hypothetical protein
LVGSALAAYGSYGLISGLAGSNGSTDASSGFAALVGGIVLFCGLALLAASIIAARR